MPLLLHAVPPVYVGAYTRAGSRAGRGAGCVSVSGKVDNETPTPEGGDGEMISTAAYVQRCVHAAPRGMACALPHLEQTCKRSLAERAHTFAHGSVLHDPFS